MALNELILSESSIDFNEELIWTNNNLYYSLGPEIGKTAIFLLQQELMYAANISGAGNILNPAAVLGLIPFTQGLLPTTVDDTIGVPLLLGRQKPVLEVKKQLNIGNGFVTSNDEDNNLITSNGLEAPGDITSIVADFAKDAISQLKKEIKTPLPKVDTKLPKTFVRQQQETAISNEIPKAYDDDILFYFESLNYEKNKYIRFRGIIENMSESFSPVWNATEIFGRIHSLWTYSNVNRNINLDFLIYAEGSNELNRVYEQTNWLAKHTYPVIEDKNGFSIFKSGPIIGITIGGLYTNLKGFISSLEYDWNYLKRWSYNDGTGHYNSRGKMIPNTSPLSPISTPQGVRVSMRFTVLEDKVITNTTPNIPKTGEASQSQKETVYTIYNPFKNNYDPFIN